MVKMGNNTGKHHKKTKKQGLGFLKFLFLILIIITAIFLSRKYLIKDKLSGSWTSDGVTIYEFNGKGEGKLLTSISSYNFSYKIKKNRVYIDFKEEKIEDTDYEFYIENGKLELKEDNKTYNLNRK